MSFTGCNSEPRQRNFFRQAVILTGLGCESFCQAVQSIYEIHQIFSRTFEVGSIEGWSTSTFEGHEAIDMSNRFFTPRQHATSNQITTFTRAVDPDNILKEAMNQDDKFTHTTDNEVDYYELMTDSEGIIR